MSCVHIETPEVCECGNVAITLIGSLRCLVHSPGQYAGTRNDSARGGKLFTFFNSKFGKKIPNL